MPAWTATAFIHWIAPIIGLGLSVGGTFLVIQGIFLYPPFNYSKYFASIFATNDLTRSTMAAAAILQLVWGLVQGCECENYIGFHK